MIVEDEAALRGLIRRFLEGEGFRLMEAANGVEALAVADASPEAIDLMITDIVMPELDGFDLAQRFTDDRPETKILMISGYRDRYAAVRNGVPEVGLPYLWKPFTRTELLREVERLLRDGEDVLPWRAGQNSAS